MADQKLTALATISNLTDDDLIYVVDDPGGTPLSRGITRGDFRADFGLTDFTSNGNWKVFYTNGSGDVVELALGASGDVLQSNGASSAPSFVTPAGGDGNGIYDGSGSLTASTTVTMGANNLIFDAAGGGDFDINVLNGGSDFTVSTLTYTNSFRVIAGTTQINSASLANDVLGGGVHFAARSANATRLALGNVGYTHEDGASTIRSLISTFLSAGVTTGAYSNHDYMIRTNNLERVVVKNSGNVGIGGDPNASALLEVTSTTQGFRITPMTAAQAAAITVQEGLMVFTSDTDATFTSIGFWGYENGAWAKL